MNCELVQKKLTQTLAAGVTQISNELAAHVHKCNACHAFHQSETKLFSEMEATLRGLTNRPVPPSLLPRVREQLTVTVPALNWTHSLLPATAALVLAGLMGMSVFHRPAPTLDGPSRSVNPSLASITAGEQPPIEATQVKIRTSDTKNRVSRRNAQPPLGGAGKAAQLPEVLFDHEESRGLRILSSRISSEPSVGNAILHPVTVSEPVADPRISDRIVPLEVASLEIQSLTEEDR